MQNDRSSADEGIITQADASEYDGVRPHLHSLAQLRNGSAGSPLANGDKLSKHTARSDLHLVMNNDLHSVVECQARADIRLVVELDAHDPMDQNHIKPENRQPKWPERGATDPLTKPEEAKNDASFGVSLVGLPVLKDSSHCSAIDPVHIQFFIPEHHLPDKARRAMWEAGVVPDLLPSGKAASAQAWLFQTWMAVRDEVDSSIVQSLPENGIVVTLSNLLPPNFRASRHQFIAAVVADFLPHSGAQLQILQNAAHARRLPGSIFMPHWPQPNLIPRNPARGDAFETVAFFGDEQNLAPELRTAAFKNELREVCGLQLRIQKSNEWHDYSAVDAVLAVRDFSNARHLHKPATKLYNAWIAGVPFISGCDSACAAEAKNGTEYFTARSKTELLKLLAHLKNNPALRKATVEAGQKKSASRNRDAVRRLWVDFLGDQLPLLMTTRQSQSNASRFLRETLLSLTILGDRFLRS